MSFAINDLVTVDQTLLDGETGFVTQQGSIVTSAEPAVAGSGDWTLGVAGSIYSSGTIAVASVSLESLTTTAIITVAQSGLISGNGGIGIIATALVSINSAGTIAAQEAGIQIVAAPSEDLPSVDATITNSGTISSMMSGAIILDLGAGTASIINDGFIASYNSQDKATIDISLAEPVGFAPRAVIRNSGTITAGADDANDTAIAINGRGVSLTSTGTIIGDIVVATDTASTFRISGLLDGSLSSGNGFDRINLTGATVTGSVTGGLGADVYIVTSQDILLTEVTGDDLGLIDTVSSSVSWALGANFENLGLSGAADISGSGNALDNTLSGNSGDNTLFGRGGNDALAGNDGADTMFGGLGNDFYRADGDDFIQDSGGTDQVVVDGESFSLSGGIENLTITGAENVQASGNALNNVIITGSGDDQLNGIVGADRLEGGLGNDTYVTDGGDTLVDTGGTDTVVAGPSSFTLATGFERLFLNGNGAQTGIGNGVGNTIVGSNFANTINGLLGKDTLTGNSGADVFVFSSTLDGSNFDAITDFDVAADTIRLDNAVFTGLAAGALAAADFRASATGTAGDASDRILLESDTGRLFFDADGTGASARVFFATVSAGLGLTAADFIIA